MLRSLGSIFSLGLILTLFPSFSQRDANQFLAHTEKRQFKEQNQRKCPSKGPKRFMVIQKAAHAQIEKSPTDEDSLLITFDNVDPYVTYYKVEPNRNFGILTIKQFMWYCHMGRSMFSQDNPRGAMGYLSFECPEEEGKTLNFNVFQLNKPHYDKRLNRLTYQISSLPGFKVDNMVIGNVILTIDLSLN